MKVNVLDRRPLTAFDCRAWPSAISYGWNDTGTFEGSAEVTGDLQLTSGNTFTCDASIQFFDAAGDPAPFTPCGSAEGARFQ